MPDHVCGLRGFDPMRGDDCPACPTSQAVTPTDEKLEKLMDGFGQAIYAWPTDLTREQAARTALREYVSARTLTEDELRTLYNSVDYPLYDKIRRRAPMKEHPE